jgi:hypothetical protein
MHENTLKVSILDPYYMKDIYLQTEGTWQIVTNYIQDFMVANKEKTIFLVTCDCWLMAPEKSWCLVE